VSTGVMVSASSSPVYQWACNRTWFFSRYLSGQQPWSPTHGDRHNWLQGYHEIWFMDIKKKKEFSNEYGQRNGSPDKLSTEILKTRLDMVLSNLLWCQKV